MGTDIHVIAERRTANGWQVVNLPRMPFDQRNYAMFGLLAGVRNYSAVEPIAEDRGLPDDCTQETREFLDWTHGNTWISLEELARIDPAHIVEDRRYTAQTSPNVWDGGQTKPPGQGVKLTILEFLGSRFFDDVLMCQEHGVERLCFGFDS